MRVLLITPQVHNSIFTAAYLEPLGLEAISATIPDCDIIILDMRFERTPLIEHLKRFNPHVVGITGTVVDVYNMRKIVNEVKLFNREIFTIVGGHHASIIPKDFNFPFIDAIVIGIGEPTFKELIETIIQKRDIREVSNLGIPNSNGLLFTKERNIPYNLDDFPFPRRDLTIKYRNRYKYIGHRICLISTAKGCPFRCRFCSIWKEMREKYITKSPRRILEELFTIPQKRIRFADGNTFGDPKRMEMLYKLLKDSGLKKRFIFDMRSDTIVQHSSLLEKWSSIGLELVSVGLESIKDKQLRFLKKGSTVKQNIEAINILQSNGIKIAGQFIIDQDFEEKDFDDLLEFAIKNRINLATYSILTPFPGTQLFNEKQNELITDNYELFDLFHSVFPTRLDRKEFFNHFANLYKRTYTFKRYFLHKWERFLNFIGIKEEPRKDVPFFILFIVKILLFTKLKALRNAFLSTGPSQEIGVQEY